MIAITTMDLLPEHCFECPCYDGESGYCQADRIHETVDERPSWCPLKEIVRCRDCKHAVLTTSGEVKYCKCWQSDEDGTYGGDPLYLDGNYYCADGERR